MKPYISGLNATDDDDKYIKHIIHQSYPARFRFKVRLSVRVVSVEVEKSFMSLLLTPVHVGVLLK